ncbi:cation:proton antiporter [Streptomyces sp. NPDC050388]|uniref:cation:proton antiporter n=1 Tax=Streptomyces sp. NPDC050388 TaxID=3155781 RepID=UPI00343FBB0A
MTVPEAFGTAAHGAAVLAVVLLLAAAGRRAARRLRQPEVVGEVTMGLVAAPLVLALAGRPALDTLLPPSLVTHLSLLGQAALVLFLVGATHRLGPGVRPRSMSWVVAGSLVPPLCCGAALVGVVALTGDRAARGDAPLPAFLLMAGVAMSITAVPVLSRILADRGMTGAPAGRVALASAVAIDSVGWVMLSVALALRDGDGSGTLHALSGLAVCAGCGLALRHGLRLRAVTALAGRRPRLAAVALGGVALAVAAGSEHLGMTAVLGAAVVGLSVPGDDPAWARAVASVSRLGAAGTPLFFVVTGLDLAGEVLSAASWTLVAAAVLLGCAGKLAGGWAGARLGGMNRADARRVGALMNTRGLTELVVLQAGFSAGILPAPLVLAMLVMALVTTAMTGPLLDLADRARRRAERPPPRPARGTPVTKGSLP